MHKEIVSYELKLNKQFIKYFNRSYIDMYY